MNDIKPKIQSYIAQWERRGYPDGIPDEAPAELERLNNKVPSYRLICLAIIKNDKQLESLGFTRRPCEIYNILKREELEARGVEIRKPCQLRLF